MPMENFDGTIFFTITAISIGMIVMGYIGYKIVIWLKALSILKLPPHRVAVLIYTSLGFLHIHLFFCPYSLCD